jgi:CheY-like chemotaxis protein
LEGDYIMPEVYLQNLAAGDGGECDPGCGIAVSHFPFVIGRQGDCDHRIRHELISRRHCSFFLRDGETWVDDDGSRNGTYLNGKAVREAKPVRAGNLLNLAHVFFFEVHRPASLATPILSDEPADCMEVPAGQCKRVLVVEDNEDAAATLALVLTRWGHKVRVAHDGPQALEAAEAHRPDTVLLDIRMSGMDGCRVAECLRAQSGMDKARIVAITGYDPDRVPCPPQGRGFDQLLTKPVDPRALQQILRQAPWQHSTGSAE